MGIGVLTQRSRAAEKQRKNHPLSLITLPSCVATIVIFKVRSVCGLGAEGEKVHE
jgi:hypothetical protein